MSDDHVIEVEGLVTRFGEHVVHDGLDLAVRRGEILGVVGGSGTGKSVLLRAMIGLLQPAGGSVRVLGEEVTPLHSGETSGRSRGWGVLFQNGALFSGLTVAENVEVPLIEHVTMSRGLRRDVARLKISMAGLPADAENKYPSELSGGMRKRAALARALALDPGLLFLDEPTAGLDPIGASAFDELIRTLADAMGLTVFLITHDLDTLWAICDRVAVLADGQVLAVDTIPALMKLDHPWVQDYFAGPRGRAAGLGHDEGQRVEQGG